MDNIDEVMNFESEVSEHQEIIDGLKKLVADNKISAELAGVMMHEINNGTVSIINSYSKLEKDEIKRGNR